MANEPVAWRYRYGDSGMWKYADKREDVNPGEHYQVEALFALSAGLSMSIPIDMNMVLNAKEAEKVGMERITISVPVKDILYATPSATEGRKIELIGLALDRMIESLDADIASEEPGNHATIGGMVGERNGLKMARELIRRPDGSK